MQWIEVLVVALSLGHYTLAEVPQAALMNEAEVDTCAKYGTPANFTRLYTIDYEFSAYALRPSAPDTRINLTVNKVGGKDIPYLALAKDDIYSFELTDGVVKIIRNSNTDNTEWTLCYDSTLPGSMSDVNVLEEVKEPYLPIAFVAVSRCVGAGSDGFGGKAKFVLIPQTVINGEMTDIPYNISRENSHPVERTEFRQEFNCCPLLKGIQCESV